MLTLPTCSHVPSAFSTGALRVPVLVLSHASLMTVTSLLYRSCPHACFPSSNRFLGVWHALGFRLEAGCVELVQRSCCKEALSVRIHVTKPWELTPCNVCCSSSSLRFHIIECPRFCLLLEHLPSFLRIAPRWRVCFWRFQLLSFQKKKKGLGGQVLGAGCGLL